MTRTLASPKYLRPKQPTLRLSHCARTPRLFRTILSMSDLPAEPPRLPPMHDSGRPLLLHSHRVLRRPDLAQKGTKCRLVLIREHESAREQPLQASRYTTEPLRIQGRPPNPEDSV